MDEPAHHVVIDGRRWRATDPAVAEPFRQELVDELMAARRAVGSARRRVQDAKVALGERGHPWWEPADAGRRAPRIGSTVLALLRHRAPGGSICPSDVARAIGGPGWRSLMDEVRDQARALALDREVHLTARGEVLDPGETPRGPIRIRLGPAPD